jgi:hypothetical protein
MGEIPELNRRLVAHSEELMSTSHDYRIVAKKAVTARNALDIARAKTQLIVRADPVMSKWTVDEKKAQVTMMVEKEMVECHILEMQLESIKMRLRAVDSSLSSVQTQARLIIRDKDLDNYRT